MSELKPALDEGQEENDAQEVTAYETLIEGPALDFCKRSTSLI